MKIAEANAAALAAWFSPEFSDAITYNGVPIQGHVTYGGTGALASQAVLTVRKSDVPAPAYRDEVVIEGITWRVHQDQNHPVIIKGDALTWDIALIKGERKAL